MHPDPAVGLHGGAAGGTIFPEPIAQAMSWNVSVVSKIAAVIAAEASAIGVDLVLLAHNVQSLSELHVVASELRNS